MAEEGGKRSEGKGGGFLVYGSMWVWDGPALQLLLPLKKPFSSVSRGTMPELWVQCREHGCRSVLVEHIPLQEGLDGVG